MAYGRNNRKDSNYDVDSLKRKLDEEMPGLDIDNINQQDIQNILMDKIVNNPDININEDIKEKISKGDMDGLKESLINHLSEQDDGSGSNERIKEMLFNDDYEGLKSELMSMFFKSMANEKKNNLEDNEGGKAESSPNLNPLAGLLDETFLNGIIDKFYQENKDDNRIALLNSMKPFLSNRRQKAIDESIKVLNLISMVERLGFKAGR